MMIMVGRALQIPLFLVFIHYFLFMIAASGFYPNGSRSDGVILCIDKERQALLTFKQGLVDDYDVLSFWENEDCCKWWGVRCDNKTGHVIRLDLGRTWLKGTISSSLLELQHLRYMDLSTFDFNGSSIPKFIGSFSNLRYLDLSLANFSGIPFQLGNLSNLQSLSLGFNDIANVENLEWLSHLSSLKYLNLGGLNLSRVTDWVQVFTNLPHLTYLDLYYCELPVIIPKSLSLVNASTFLATIELSGNNLTSCVYRWLFNFSSTLVYLSLNDNLLKGSIPTAFGNMTSLSFLNLANNQLEGEISKAFGNMTSLSTLCLSNNQLEGEIPKSLGTLCGLQRLFLDDNNLSGKFTGSIDNWSHCKESSLQSLYLSNNQFTGPFPNLTRFSSNLRDLSLSYNQLNGAIPESLSQLSMLNSLDLSSNFLQGVISEAQFSNLSRLKSLDLSFNSLALDFKADWVPPFQLDYIKLRSCKLGPHFPKWLLSQNNFSYLDISRTGISDSVPSSFWDLSLNLNYLNLSHNQINGTIANSLVRYNIDSYPGIDLSSNHFEGPIPQFLLNAASLNLSGNKFSGPITFLCSVKDGKLTSLDLSYNLLSGELPDCWLHVKDLVILNLATNNFTGKIPNSMGFLQSIESLQLQHNNFVGGLPSSLKNCTQLRYMDVAENKLSGKLPTWIRGLSKLIILIVRSNQFRGNMSSYLCHLAYIQVLDLSFNNISGSIPKCINNFTVMAQIGNTTATISHEFSIWLGKRFIFSGGYNDEALFGWKQSMFEFRNTLGLVKLIDLSSNNLTGEIPTEITQLLGLISLNLSRNNLTGHIPERIGQLTMLDALDLSRNKFYGGIPPSLSQIQRLAVLDLSNNKLSGKIPTSTQLQSFNASTYEGNPDLCGAPLPNKCNGKDLHVRRSSKSGKHEFEYGFYVSVVLGFVVGFWGVCGTLVLNRSWRYAYFNFLKDAKDWVYVRAVVYKAKLQKATIN